MKNNIKDNITIIGLGKVGTAMGFLLRSAGYPIVGIVDQSASAVATAITYTGGQVFRELPEAVSKADCVIITTADDAITLVCEKLAQDKGIRPGCKVIHMSGAGGLDLLESARIKGAHLASIHPIQTFADIESAIENIPGSVFGITADEQIKSWSETIVKDVGGIPFFVREADKALYHAAACIASNYLTTLIHIVINSYQMLGLNQDDAINAFWPLIKGTLKNIKTKGTIHSLTGPIVRGDIGTIRKHLHIIEEKIPTILSIYCELGLKTVDLGLEKGTISYDKSEAIKNLLKGELKNG